MTDTTEGFKKHDETRPDKSKEYYFPQDGEKDGGRGSTLTDEERRKDGERSHESGGNKR
jgi:hypothetical protein